MFSSLFKKNSFFYRLFLLLIFIVITGVAYIARDYAYMKESARYPDFVPFTLESAMMYSYSWDIAENGYLKQKDPALTAMADYRINEQMSISLEYFLGYAFRLKNAVFDPCFKYVRNSIYGVNTQFVSWVRCQIRLWISITAGLIFLWLLLLRVPLFYSITGGLLFAIAPAAIARATGQDLIRENFAIVFIAGTLVAAYWYLYRPKIYKLFFPAAAIFLALISWDMTQLFLCLWLLHEFIRIFSGGGINRKRLLLWSAVAAGTIAAGISNPYLITHKFLLSPAVIILLPSLLLVFSLHRVKHLHSKLVGSLFLCGLVVLWYFVIRKFGYSENYSHFAALIRDKIYFNNIKPADPKLLGFDSRILWTPALHSATVKIFWYLYHFIVISGILALFYTLVNRKARQTFFRRFSRLNLVFFLSSVIFIFFIFMVRFHALAIPFICVAVTIIFSDIAYAGKSLTKIIIKILLTTLLIVECGWLISLERKYNETEYSKLELVKELNTSDVHGKTILASFTLSPWLKAYCGAGIVLQPKFELGKTRDLVKQYLNNIYFGTEYTFMEFCEKYGAEYFIFDKGMGGAKKAVFLHPWSSRYVAGAYELKPATAMYAFYYAPGRMKYFYKLDQRPCFKNLQDRFEIFKVITPKDKRKAETLYKIAYDYFCKGNKTMAGKMVAKGLSLEPNSAKLRYLFFRMNNQWPEIAVSGLINPPKYD